MMYLKYFISVFLWQFLNPFGIWQSILQNGGQIIAILRSRISKVVTPSISMSLPFDGCWTVVNGGIDKTSSHSWNVITQRYAYDFVFSGMDGEKYTGDGSKSDSYYAISQDVLAPADGIVIKVQNNIRDYAHAGTGTVDLYTRDMRGNYLIIRHAKHIYSFIAHLKKASCRVKPGDFVKCGQVIGQCGNSGHSTEPHIHFHVQDHPSFYLAVGLPILFKNIEIEYNTSQTADKVEYGYISKNCKVRNLSTDEKMPNDSPEELPPTKGELFILFTSALNVLGLTVWLFFVYIYLIQPILRASKQIFIGS
ncbi:MAG: M23 family metallopeptidase [Fidelibacterota bacterium]